MLLDFVEAVMVLGAFQEALVLVPKIRYLILLRQALTLLN